MTDNLVRPLKITKKLPAIYEIRYSHKTRGFRDNRTVRVITTDVRRAITLAEHAIVDQTKTADAGPDDVRILQVIHRGDAQYIDPLVLLEVDENGEDI